MSKASPASRVSSGSVDSSSLDPLECTFKKFLSEFTKLFEDLGKENMALKEELQKLKHGEGRLPTVGFESSELPDVRYFEKEGRESRMLASQSLASQSLASQNVQSYRSLASQSLQSYRRDPFFGTDHGTEFFPEWPLNLQMHGRASRISTLAPEWRGLQQPLQVPIQLWDEVKGNFDHDLCLISPNSYFRLTWDLFSCAVLVVQFWLTPFSLVFMPEAGAPAYFSRIDDYTTLFFAMDMILNFNTGVIRQVEDYDWVIMNRRLAAKDYCAFFFWVDLVSTIPYDRLLQHGESQLFSMIRIMRIARWLKLLRFLRMTRLLKMLRSVNKSFELEIERMKKNLFFPLVAIAIIAVLAHMNACILQALNPREVLPDNMYDIYFQRLGHIVLTLVAGRHVEAYEECVWILDLSMALERLAMLAVAGFCLVYQAMLLLEPTVKHELLKKGVLVYMEKRQVSYKTQLQVLNQLNEATKLARVKQGYEAWIASGIPVELERRICQELWLPRLRTLGLIDHVLHLEPELKDELTLIVREETMAKQNILFKEGALPLDAYLVMQGVICATSSMIGQPLPLFTEDMWIGEKALVSPEMVRTITCVCKTTCTLMAVSAQSFRKLLLDHGVLGRFEEYCVQNLWKGICGRCGVVGDHFAHECPLICSSSMPAMYSMVEEDEEQYSQEPINIMDPGCALPSERTSEVPVPMERLAKPDLKEFLRCHNIQYLSSNLEINGIWSLADLQELSPELVDKIVSDVADVEPDLDQEEFRKVFSVEYIETFQDGLEDRAKKVLGTSELRSQHLIFLSHHKVDCGTEATLLRQELEVQIQDDLRLKIMEAPVFLDSEDLQSLEKLTEHVANTHTIVLLLSKFVLTRPWVLVELVTAERLDLPVIPVEVRKPGQQFEYPDEEFYGKLAGGTMLPPSSLTILESCDVSLEDVESSIRRVFQTISLPYSPHRPAQHRKLEVADILSHCDLQTATAGQQKKQKRRAITLRSSTNAS